MHTVNLLCRYLLFDLKELSSWGETCSVNRHHRPIDACVVLEVLLTRKTCGTIQLFSMALHDPFAEICPKCFISRDKKRNAANEKRKIFITKARQKET